MATRSCRVAWVVAGEPVPSPPRPPPGRRVAGDALRRESPVARMATGSCRVAEVVTRRSWRRPRCALRPGVDSPVTRCGASRLRPGGDRVVSSGMGSSPASSRLSPPRPPPGCRVAGDAPRRESPGRRWRRVVSSGSGRRGPREAVPAAPSTRVSSRRWRAGRESPETRCRRVLSSDVGRRRRAGAVLAALAALARASIRRRRVAGARAARDRGRLGVAAARRAAPPPRHSPSLDNV